MEEELEKEDRSEDRHLRCVDDIVLVTNWKCTTVG